MNLTVGFGKPLVPDGVYVGTALVSTSSSFALRLPNQAGGLQEKLSHHSVSAALGPDHLSLMLVCVMFNWRTEFHFFIGISCTVTAFRRVHGSP